VVYEVTTEEFGVEIHESDRVVVKFYADWCAPCKVVAPTVERLAEIYDGRVNFLSVDIEAEPSVAAAYAITTLPTIVLFKHGQPVARESRQLTTRALTQLIENNL
jgi:thioredoxin